MLLRVKSDTPPPTDSDARCGEKLAVARAGMAGSDASAMPHSTSSVFLMESLPAWVLAPGSACAGPAEWHASDAPIGRFSTVRGLVRADARPTFPVVATILATGTAVPDYVIDRATM